ncbi:helix-turn-helix domain-containing protein [Lichenibacterium minor]|nr:helix-turn-helix domain-containing protein [Lichenibacterium minor]
MTDTQQPPETIHERIKFLRTMKGYKSASEAARAYGWTVSTYLGYENGDREPSKKMAQRIAEAFGVGINYLLIGQGLIFGESDELFKIPIIGDVFENGEISPKSLGLPVEGYSEISTSIPILNATIGVRVAGSTMWPRYEDGDILGFVRTGQNPHSLIDGCEAVVRLSDGRRLIRKISKSNTQGLIHLHGHNTPSLFDQAIVWAAEITSVVRSTSVIAVDASAEARDLRRRMIARTAQGDFFGEGVIASEEDTEEA